MPNDIELVECGNCNTPTDPDELITTPSGSVLCSDCRIYCERCDEYAYSDDSSHIEGSGTWCRECANNYSYWCDNCSNSYDNDYSSYYIQDVGVDWCESCCNDNANWCDTCEEYNRDSCENCDGGGVLEYNVKPDPIFHGHAKDNLYFGLELEMEISDNKVEYNNAVQYVSDRLDNDYIYLKSDASIGRLDGNKVGPDGFEMVSHPASFDYWSNNSQNLWDTLDGLRTRHNARAWNAKSNCGIHIHISRAGFKSGAHTHRFLSLVYKNTKYMKRFAGRDCGTYATFTDVWKYNEDNKPYMSFTDKLVVVAPDMWGNDDIHIRTHNRRVSVNNTERMSAVNTRNLHTIELRFFRGTTKPKGVLATIELAHAMVEYTRNLTLSDVKLGMLDWEWFVDYIQVNNGLYPNAYARIPELDKVRLNYPELINA